jgi:hypothetical protein
MAWKSVSTRNSGEFSSGEGAGRLLDSPTTHALSFGNELTMLSNSDSGRGVNVKGKDWQLARFVTWQTGRPTGCAGDFFQIGTACHDAM